MNQLFKHYAMKTFEGEKIAPPFLTSELDESEWSASLLSGFTNGEGAPGTHCIGEEKHFLLCRESNTGRPARSLSQYRLSYPGSISIILLLFHICIDLKNYEAGHTSKANRR
jgi:hypothetical protein